ncbi:MAG: NosD domain-containing protein [Candidatus Heimdallarchaeota archaeon]
MCISLWLVFYTPLPIQEPQSLAITQTRDFPLFVPKPALAHQKPSKMLQNWNVTSSETRTGETIIAEKLTVHENVTLTLVNCTLQINSTEVNMGEVEIHGTLILQNYTLVRAVNPSFGYHFLLRSTSFFNVSDSTIRGVGTDSPARADRGIHLNGKQATLRSTNITNCIDGLVITTKNPVWILDSRIVNSTMTGIRVEGEGGNVVVENSVMEGHSYGVLIYRSFGNNTFRGCNITSSSHGIGIFDWAYYSFQYGVDPLANNSLDGNRITSLETGIMVDSSFNNSILGNWVASQDTGIALESSDNNVIHGNQIISENTGITLRLSDGNRIEINEIETNSSGSGIVLEPGTVRNLLRQNIIRSAGIGIGMRTASLITITDNQIFDTEQAAILIETCYRANISFNEIMVSSGVGLSISESSSVVIENNTVIVSSRLVDPAIYLDGASYCSFIANQISTQGPAFYFARSSNILLLENTVSSISGLFLLADDPSKNITLNVWNNVNITALFPQSTLIIIPPAALKPEIITMALKVEARGEMLSFSNVTAPNLELMLDAFDIGSGNFTITVTVTFLNGTEIDWTFSLYVHGESGFKPSKEIAYTTTSKAGWNILIPLLLGILLFKGWNWRKRK